LTKDSDRTDQTTLFQHRHIDERPYTAKLNGSDNCRSPLLGVGPHRRQVSDVSDLPRFCKSAKAAARRRIYHRPPLKILGKRARRVVKRNPTEACPLAQPKNSKVSVAKAHSIFKHCNKHGLKITR
jgi:hypothetical protein